MSGSTLVPQRSQWPTAWRYGSSRSSSPSSSSSSRIAPVGLLLRQPREPAGLRVHAAVEPDHHRLVEAVLAADLEVDRVVSRRDLERSSAELGLDPLVGDDRHAALDDRHDHLLPTSEA